MTLRVDFDKIELYLIRVLQTLITERSVSRAAMRLQSTQPAVSAQLKRLRALTGDPLLVRAGNNMAPTETALRLLEPATRAWTAERYLACEHVAPSALHTGLDGAAPGVIEEHLASLHLKRDVMVRSAHFSLIPLMVAQSLLVLTTGRLFCSRYVDNLPVRIVRCPVPFPALTYYQLWHDLTHASASGRWLREQVRDVAGKLGSHGMLQRARPAGAGEPSAH